MGKSKVIEFSTWVHRNFDQIIKDEAPELDCKSCEEMGIYYPTYPVAQVVGWCNAIHCPSRMILISLYEKQIKEDRKSLKKFQANQAKPTE